jgi:hypothetical protein
LAEGLESFFVRSGSVTPTLSSNTPLVSPSER